MGPPPTSHHHPLFITPLPRLNSRLPVSISKITPRTLISAQQDRASQLTRVNHVEVQGPGAILGVIAGAIGERVRRTIWNVVERRRKKRWENMGRELLGVSGEGLGAGSVSALTVVEERVKKAEGLLEEGIKDEVVVVEAMELKKAGAVGKRKVKKGERMEGEGEVVGEIVDGMVADVADEREASDVWRRKKRPKRAKANSRRVPPVDILPPTFSHLDYLKAQAAKKKK